MSVAYHPMFSPMGTKNFSDGNDWESTTVTVNSIYDCIANAGTGNGRPDSKTSSKIYLKGEGGLAPHSLFYAKDSEFGRDKDVVGLSSGSVSFYSNSPATGSSATDYLAINNQYVVPTTTLVEHYKNTLLNKYFMYWSAGVTPTIVRVINVFNNIGVNLGVTFDVSIDRTNGYWYPASKHPQLLTYGENLKLRMYSDLNDMPSSWKSHLSSGGVPGIEPALVSDSGTSLIPDGAIDDFGLVNGKAKTVLSGVRTADNGGTWSSFTPTTDYVGNKVTMTNEPSGNVVLVSSVDYSAPYVQLDPQKITKVTHIHEVVYSGDSYDVESNNLILNQVSGIIQTGNNQIVKSLPITAIDNSTDLFDYIDDATNTTPTFIMFDAILNDGAKVQCIWGSSDGVIDKSNVYGRRY